jgi:UrcA family protein
MSNSITHRFRKAGQAIVLGSATVLFALTAQAGSARPAANDSVVVRYDDLNLATAAGTQALYARISSAADRACGGQPSIRELRMQQQYRACYDRAVEKAVKKVDSARLQALHAERASATKVG